MQSTNFHQQLLFWASQKVKKEQAQIRHQFTNIFYWSLSKTVPLNQLHMAYFQ